MILARNDGGLNQDGSSGSSHTGCILRTEPTGPINRVYAGDERRTRVLDNLEFWPGHWKDGVVIY